MPATFLLLWRVFRVFCVPELFAGKTRQPRKERLKFAVVVQSRELGGRGLTLPGPHLSRFISSGGAVAKW